MKRRLASCIPCIAITFLACSGATGSLGNAADGGSGSGCPASPPTANASCGAELACEYGSDPDVSCDTLATCASGAWSVREAPGTPCSTALGAGCPASYAALAQQSTCSTVGAACAYPEARCSCGTQCGMLGRPEAFWCCPDAPPAGGGCPSPRPRIGSACPAGGTVCDYGGCTGNVALQCTGGSWQPTQVGCPG